jgi:hypothetical protein
MRAVIIRSDKLEAAGREQGHTPAQPCATRDSAQINPTCVAGETHPHGIAGVRELVTVRIATLGAGERIVATIRCSKHLNSPASFQSAHASRAVTAGASSVISAPLRFFQFFGAFTALRAVFSRLHSAPALFQSSARSKADVFQVLSLSAGATGSVAHSDGHRDSERKIGNVRQCSGEIRHEQR